jgi:hypothetical protein
VYSVRKPSQRRTQNSGTVVLNKEQEAWDQRCQVTHINGSRINDTIATLSHDECVGGWWLGPTDTLPPATAWSYVCFTHQRWRPFSPMTRRGIWITQGFQGWVRRQVVLFCCCHLEADWKRIPSNWYLFEIGGGQERLSSVPFMRECLHRTQIIGHFSMTTAMTTAMLVVIDPEVFETVGMVDTDTHINRRGDC